MACLHVYNISGTTVLELDGEERKRLRCATHFGLALKETIQRLTGTPRFRQRLFFCGHEVGGESPLPDTERMELQLVILPLRQEKSPALIHAAQLGDLTSLTSLLEDGQDPNATNGHFSPLWAAACHGRLKVVKLLLQARADMEIADVEEQRSPLLIAADHGHWDVLHHLLEERANVNHVDSRQRTPLFQVGRQRDSISPWCCCRNWTLAGDATLGSGRCKEEPAWPRGAHPVVVCRSIETLALRPLASAGKS